jgi:hypothetical protein
LPGTDGALAVVEIFAQVVGVRLWHGVRPHCPRSIRQTSCVCHDRN